MPKRFCDILESEVENIVLNKWEILTKQNKSVLDLIGNDEISYIYHLSTIFIYYTIKLCKCQKVKRKNKKAFIEGIEIKNVRKNINSE